MELNLKKIADRYRALGFNLTCITNKENEFNRHTRNFFKTPNHLWENLSSENQSNFDFENLDWDIAVGLGTVTKKNQLVVVDIDGCSDRNILNKILLKLNLPIDYEWVVESGSKNGYHIYFYGNKIRECVDDTVVSTFPPKSCYEKYFDKIEILWETHCVLPPSVHGSGNRYEFLNKDFPTCKPLFIDNDTIYEFIEEFLDFNEIIQGQNYFTINFKIKGKSELITDHSNNDISKFLMDDIYCILDIETTGFPQKKNNEIIYPEILQIAWVLSNKEGIIIKKRSYIVNSNFFQNNTSDILNIDFQVAKLVGYPIKDILKKLIEDLKISDYVVAHNLDFDIPILTYHINKIYNNNPFKNKEMICTMKSTVDFCKIDNGYGYKYPKLSELYDKLYNFKLNNSHNAEIDVLHTLKCFKKLKKLNVI